MFKRNLVAVAIGALLATGNLAAHAEVASSPSLITAVSATHAAGSAVVTGALTDVLAAKGSGRGKPRVPGGSGCDDPEDVIEHPECAGNAAAVEEKLARRKPRVPGGSGCDDPEDLIEHPECAGNAAVGKQYLVREAGEAPRGADNERPGDRQRRGRG